MKPLKIECPRCDGDGEEPGAPVDLVDGTALCGLCDGHGMVSQARVREYEREEGASA
jgi:DnaJ-class molecular chaperone